MQVNHIEQFNSILNNFNIKASCIDYKVIDNYFFYDLRLNAAAKVKDIQKFSDEISLALKTNCRPSVKVLHNQGVVRLEFAAPRTNSLNLFDYFTNQSVPKGDLVCLLGQTVDGGRVWMDLAANPHLIIAGTSGSGKSVLMHNIIANVLNYNNAKIFLVDPKNIEFGEYERRITKNLQVTYTYANTLILLDEILGVMEQRYECIRDGVSPASFPPVLLMIDEFADLILQDTENLFYNKLCRLAQKSRAAKIHIVLATQRPSVAVIDGTIKANFPARIACRVASHVDSKVILDSVGAENLLGKGDALLKDGTRHLERFQVAYTTAEQTCDYFQC